MKSFRLQNVVFASQPCLAKIVKEKAPSELHSNAQGSQIRGFLEFGITYWEYAPYNVQHHLYGYTYYRCIYGTDPKLEKY